MSKLIELNSNLKKSLSVTDKFKEVMAPLAKKLNLTSICHVRIYKDLSKLSFSTRPDVVDWYYSNKFYKLGYSERNPRVYSSGYVFCDSWSKDTLSYAKIAEPWREQFNCDHAFALQVLGDSQVDILELAADKNNVEINFDYLRNLERIKTFFNDYLQSEFLLHHKHLKFTHDLNTVSYIDELENLDVIPVKLQNQNEIIQLDRLTKRELECCYWMSLGKKAPDIALILNLSVRTIEAYISKLKIHFNCANLYQLGFIMGQYHKIFDMLFNVVNIDSR